VNGLVITCMPDAKMHFREPGDDAYNNSAVAYKHIAISQSLRSREKNGQVRIALDAFTNDISRRRVSRSARGSEDLALWFLAIAVLLLPGWRAHAGRLGQCQRDTCPARSAAALKHLAPR
jgi:hypothetical protein